ncbi:MAG: hypothetical protein HQK53_00540 [Oligoflexia bacterium]|nr:hypothetical protein [Oligoflexia bacterium]
MFEPPLRMVNATQLQYIKRELTFASRYGLLGRYIRGDYFSVPLFAFAVLTRDSLLVRGVLEGQNAPDVHLPIYYRASSANYYTMLPKKATELAQVFGAQDIVKLLNDYGHEPRGSATNLAQKISVVSRELALFFSRKLGVSIEITEEDVANMSAEIIRKIQSAE